jgi:phage protein U
MFNDEIEDAKRLVSLARQASHLMAQAQMQGVPSLGQIANVNAGSIAGITGNVFMTMETDDGVHRFSFGIGTVVYQSLSRNSEYRWASQDRINRGPAKQFIGVGNQDLSMPCTLLTQMAGGRNQGDALRAIAKHGRPVSLTDYYGVWHGFWVIKKIGEVKTQFMADGVEQKQEITIDFDFYGEDFEGGRQPFNANLSSDSAVALDF